MAPGSARARRDVRRAWLFLLLILPAFVPAALVDKGLLSLQGYDAGDSTVPLRATLVAGGSALLVLIAPGVSALFYGLRARRHSDPAGTAPGLAGGTVAAALLLLNIVALVVRR
ncbi:hypothetical protein [Streptomyces sp. 351MFTsu5.1]|uniref:hypothetical protein n=1 Tax=Streptomyces sp. 351MFTsu5.1 TaxID=1172180 RepID=UPI000378AD6D|nr:hypothetical protein [Streptomyces sp. 351MFTsu5.1]